MEEVWKNIEGYEGLYQVSNMGRVKSLKWGKERILRPIDNKGYLLVQLWKNKKGKFYLVHRLVSRAFIPNPDNLPFINHRDECKTNNFVDNLEYCDREYNVNYGTAIQRRSKTVYQYTLDGELVKEYPSTHDVERQLGYAQSHISKCCNGKRKTAYGYIWSYIKEPQSN